MTRPEQVKERAGWLQVVSWCAKDPRSIELFNQEKKALAQVNPLRQRELAEELWMAFYYRKRLLEKTLAKWEKRLWGQ